MNAAHRLGGALAALVAMAVPGAGCAPATSPPGAVDDTTSTATSSVSPSAQPSASASAQPSSTASSTAAAGACVTRARSLSRAERAGLVLMLGHPVSTPVGPQTRARLREEHIGSVLLLENTSIGVRGVRRVTDRLRAAASPPAGGRLLVAADQEGGLVQRLQGAGFDQIPSAQAQAGQSDASLRRHATTWGRQLRAAGVDIDFAPVADVVPPAYRSTNEPVSLLRRGYGSDQRVVSAKVRAFVTGMDAAGVATSVKHFPGIGAVRGNTDFSAGVRDTSTTRRDARLRGFAAGIDAGADLVMVSTVTYSRIDARHQAVFSPTVMTMLRSDLGFDGVIVSDDLGAARAVTHIAPGQRAVRFLRAGGDLVINADPSLIDDMARAVRAEMKADPAFELQVTASAARVLELRQHRGLGRCG